MKITLECDCGNVETVEVNFFSTEPFDKFKIYSGFDNEMKLTNQYFYCKKCRDVVHIEDLCEDNVDY